MRANEAGKRAFALDQASSRCFPASPASFATPRNGSLSARRRDSNTSTPTERARETKQPPPLRRNRFLAGAAAGPTRCAKHNSAPPLVPIWDISGGWGLVHQLGEALLC